MSELTRLALGDASPIIRRVVTVPSPAAGAELSVVVPGDQVWRILAINFVLTTSAAAGARNVILLLSDGTTTVMRWPCKSNQGATSVFSYSYQSGWPTQNVDLGGAQVEPLPLGLVVPAGYRIASSTGAFDVADQYSAINVWIDQGVYGVNPWDLARRSIEDVYDEPTAFL